MRRAQLSHAFGLSPEPLARRAGRRRSAPARRIAAARGVVGAADRDAVDRRLRAAAPHPRPQRRLVTRFGALHERHTNQLRAGLQRERKFERSGCGASTPTTCASAACTCCAHRTCCIDRPRASARHCRSINRGRRGIGICRIGLTGRRIYCRSAASAAAERSQCDAFAINQDLQVVALRGAHVHPDDVRAVHGELAPHRDAAARAERQFVNALVLRMFRIEADGCSPSPASPDRRSRGG